MQIGRLALEQLSGWLNRSLLMVQVTKYCPDAGRRKIKNQRPADMRISNCHLKTRFSGKKTHHIKPNNKYKTMPRAFDDCTTRKRLGRRFTAAGDIAYYFVECSIRHQSTGSIGTHSDGAAIGGCQLRIDEAFGRGAVNLPHRQF